MSALGGLRVVITAASLALVFAVADARAVVVDAPPTWPMPEQAPAAPPIPSMPAGGDTAPPADVIADVVTPLGGCSGWFRQSRYADRWATQSSWWEYECTEAYVVYPWCAEGPGACDTGYWELGWWVDRYYWDGSQPVFYGENYLFGCDDWWDAPTRQWYLQPSCPARGGGSGGETPPNAAPTAAFTFSCTGVSCTYAADGSSDSDGTIQAYSWSFGDGASASGSGSSATHTYAHAGTYPVTLTVTDNGGATAATTTDVAVTNVSPIAAFVMTCSDVSCTYAADGSSDSDGTIQAYSWSFGDGGTGAGKSAVHSYPQPGSYVVMLTVTDNAGATATVSQKINPIALSARGYRQGGQQKVDLAWNGIAGASFDVYRDGARIRVVQGTAYTDVVPKGTHVYRVCATASATCSMEVTVTP
jgi:PKD repeat protein